MKHGSRTWRCIPWNYPPTQDDAGSSPPGLWNIFTRECQHKSLLATGWGVRSNVFPIEKLKKSSPPCYRTVIPMKHRKKKKQKLGWLNLIWSSDFWVRWKNGSVCPRRHHSMENDWISRSNLGQSLGDQETTKISPTEEWLLRDIHVNIHLLWRFLSSWPFTSSPCSFQVTEKKTSRFHNHPTLQKNPCDSWIPETWG